MFVEGIIRKYSRESCRVIEASDFNLDLLLIEAFFSRKIMVTRSAIISGGELSRVVLPRI